MTPHKMIARHNPIENEFGDCARTCFASLFDIEPADVPHFFADGDAENGWLEIQKFLSERGLWYYITYYQGGLTLDAVLKSVAVTNPDIYCIIEGASPTGSEHWCIAVNGQIVMDPSRRNGGLVEPSPNSGMWATIVFVPLLLRLTSHK